MKDLTAFLTFVGAFVFCVAMIIFAIKLVLKKETKRTRAICAISFCVAVISFVMFSINNSSNINNKKDTTPKTTVSQTKPKITVSQTESITETELSAKGVFEAGNYIIADGLKIKYNGDYSFTVINKSNKIQMLSCGIYGVKKDGTSEFLGMPAFYGIDKEQYDKDKEENGWAVEHTTNKIFPNKSLTMKMEIYDIGDVPFDVDDDGYYDIRFTVSSQRSETSVQVSTDDYQTEYYKLKAK